jgi:signal transduction histidine kinase
MLLEELKDSKSDYQKFYARTINDSSHQLYSLVENLLNWSRTQRNKMRFEPVELNISSAIEDTINLLKPNFTQKNISLEKRLISEKLAYADKNMVEMVIRNLITNAIKFTPENGKIRISLTEKDQEIRVEVSDNGIGINSEDQAKLFRIDSNFSKKGTNGEGGTGLGLIICKEFVEKNNGRIWVKSNPGEGTSFFFTIPLNNNPGDHKSGLNSQTNNIKSV